MQLEQYIADELGTDRLSSGKNQTELRKIKREIAALKKRLDELQVRKTESESRARENRMHGLRGESWPWQPCSG
jgi:hypothetical protein